MEAAESAVPLLSSRSTLILATEVVIDELSGTVSVVVRLPAATETETDPFQTQLESHKFATNVRVVVAEYETGSEIEPVDFTLEGQVTETTLSVVGAVTVIVLVAVFEPSVVVTVMVAVPAATPVTRPLLETVAAEVLLELQVTALFVAVEGATVTVNC